MRNSALVFPPAGELLGFVDGYWDKKKNEDIDFGYCDLLVFEKGHKIGHIQITAIFNPIPLLPGEGESEYYNRAFLTSPDFTIVFRRRELRTAAFPLNFILPKYKGVNADAIASLREKDYSMQSYNTIPEAYAKLCTDSRNLGLELRLHRGVTNCFLL